MQRITVFIMMLCLLLVPALAPAVAWSNADIMVHTTTADDAQAADANQDCHTQVVTPVAQSSAHDCCDSDALDGATECDASQCAPGCKHCNAHGHSCAGLLSSVPVSVLEVCSNALSFPSKPYLFLVETPNPPPIIG